jgi:hypothetical protein
MEAHGGSQVLRSTPETGKARGYDTLAANRRWRGKKNGRAVYTPDGELAGWWMRGNHGNSYLLHKSGRR